MSSQLFFDSSQFNWKTALAQAVSDAVIIRWLYSIFNSANTADAVHVVLLLSGSKLN